jgi:thioredoxin-related protein
MRTRAVILAVLAASVLISEAHAARPKWRRGDRKKRWERIKREIDKRTEDSKKTSSSKVDMVAGGKGEEALKWHTDFDAAAKLAKREKRPLMLLFSTEELTRKSRSCTFAANRVRRAVRGCKAVAVRLLPPVRLSSQGVSKEEAKKRKEFYQKEEKRYRALTRKYRITNGPALVFAGSDAKALLYHIAPKDDVIQASCGRLGELIQARQEKLAKRAGADAKAGAKPADVKDDPAKGLVPAKEGEGKKKQTPKQEAKPDEKPVDETDDDF